MPHRDPLLSTLIGLGIFAVVMVVRLRRLNQDRRLRLETMWILPALFIAGAVALLISKPPHGLDWAWLVGVAVIGASLGWWRGKLVPISVDPVTHRLNSKTSPAALIFLLALLVLRFGVRTVLQNEAQAWHLNLALVTDGFVLFAVSLISTARLEMAVRALRLLRAHRATVAA